MSTPETPVTNPRRNYLLIGSIALAGVVIAVGAAIFLLNGGDDEVETRGSCQGTSYELNAERDDEGNRMTASLEIKADAAGEEWAVTVTADGTEVVNETRTTDAEAELDVDAFLGAGEKSTEVVATFGKVGADTCTAKATLG